MATSGVVGVPFDVEITLTSQPAVNGAHSVALSVRPNDVGKITFSPPGPLTFDNSNWDTPQIISVTASEAGSFVILAEVTAAYHLVGHAIHDEISVSAEDVTPDTINGTYAGVMHPSLFQLLAAGDIAIYHDSIGVGDTNFSVVRVGGGGVYLKIRSPNGTITYQTAGTTCTVNTSSLAGRWSAEVMDPYYCDPSASPLPSVQYDLYLGPTLVDTLSTTVRGFSYLASGIVQHGSAPDVLYTEACLGIVEDFHGTDGASIVGAVITSANNLGTPGDSISVVGFEITLGVSRTGASLFANVAGGGPVKIDGVTVASVGTAFYID